MAKRDLPRHEADQCQYGLITTKDGVEGPAKKPTTFMTNAWKLAEQLGKKCDGSHRHIPLEAGRPSAAAKYPDKLCMAIVTGIRDQLAFDATALAATRKLTVDEVREVTELSVDLAACVEDQHQEDENDHVTREETLAIRQKDGEVAAVDDVTGASLDPKLVTEARALEMEWFRKKEVYTKVHRSQATGHKVVK